MGINKKGLSNVFIWSIFVYIVVLFVLSIYITWKTDHKELSVSCDLITSYALRYLTDEDLIRQGKRMDCSAFTSAVYKKFGVQLPRSSKQQYNGFYNQNTEPEPADLVFFKNDKNKISHVGIKLADSTFIHSPGRNKPVRIDSLNNAYWRENYVGTKSVLARSTDNE